MQESYIDMLKEEFLERKKRRPHYSERAFARDLKLSSGFVSLLFNRKRGLSPKTSLDVIKNIGWGEEKSKKFFESVKEEQFVSTKEVSKKVVIQNEYQLAMDEFRLLANINHFVVLEYIQSRSHSSADDILANLNVDKMECELIIERLLRLKMIRKNKDFYEADGVNRKLKATPSEAIRNYHRQALNLAIHAIGEQSFDRRELRALTLSLDPKKIKQAKKAIDRFITNFNKSFGNKKNGEVYQLNTQLFSHKKNKNEG